jgi:Domain of unknown function DUF11
MVCRLSRLLNVKLKWLALIPVLGAIAFVATPALPASAASLSADLATTLTSSGIPAVGGYMGYTMTVTNNGPDSASNVVLTDHTPWYPWSLHPTTFHCVGSGTAWCGPLSSGVLCTHPAGGSPGTVTCTTTASLPRGASMTITLVVQVGFYWHSQLICDTATATSSTFDPNTANNTATVCAGVH